MVFCRLCLKIQNRGVEGETVSDISVLGLGQMGAAMARALLASGRSVTVWNRSLDVFVDQMPLTLKAAGLYADNFQRKAPEQNYDDTEATLETYLGALNGILNTSKETGTTDDLPLLMRDLAQRGYNDGHAERDVTVLIKTLLKKS